MFRYFIWRTEQQLFCYLYGTGMDSTTEHTEQKEKENDYPR